MSGYLFFKSSGLLFPRLTEQHPFTRLPHAMRSRVFDEAHRETSKCLNWLQRSGRTETRILQQIKAGPKPTPKASSSLLFGAAMAERDSEHTSLLSQGTRGTLERSRDGFYARLVF
jgi:hypothetical protein